MTLANPLQVSLLRKASGPRLVSGDSVWVWYEGQLLNGTRFDANYNFSSFTAVPNRSEFNFRLGVGQVIQGWDQALLNRQVGEVLELTIPANLAYGASGAGALIPPNATLRFKVEILARRSSGSTAIEGQTFTNLGINSSGFTGRLGQVQAYKIGLDQADQLDGGALADLLVGLDGNDRIIGGSGADILVGGNGNDQLEGGAGDDYLEGGPGSDTATYGAANNRLNLALSGPQASGEGSDTLMGIENINAGAGDDGITGNQGPNSLNGGAGRDVLTGGGGQDRLTGADGADTFLYSLLTDSRPGSTNRDILTDFNGSQGDRIDLSALDASSTLPGNQAFTYIGALPFSGRAGEVRFAAGLLQINTTADSLADMEITLTGVSSFLSGHLIA
jgi:Ca2+-binding RTX toxin-like protein